MVSGYVSGYVSAAHLLSTLAQRGTFQHSAFCVLRLQTCMHMDILIATSYIVNSGLDALREESDVVVCISVCTCVYVNIACAIVRISAIVCSSRVQFVQCVCTCVCV